MEIFDKNFNGMMEEEDSNNYYKIVYQYLDNIIQFINNNGDSAKNDADDKADINTEEKENVKELQQYQQYQEDQQNKQPWSSNSDIRIVESDELPDPHPITDTEVCPKCGNNQARWWIVQTDSADEPSTQFFRCTRCMHTWRTPKTS